MLKSKLHQAPEAQKILRYPGFARKGGDLIRAFFLDSRDVTSFAQISVRHVGVKFMLIMVHLHEEASLLLLDYFPNYMNIQKEKRQ